jgi:hypothetical protein
VHFKHEKSIIPWNGHFQSTNYRFDTVLWYVFILWLDDMMSSSDGASDFEPWGSATKYQSTSSRTGFYIQSTAKNYESHIKKFCEHFNAVFNAQGFPLELLTDAKIPWISLRTNITVSWVSPFYFICPWLYCSASTYNSVKAALNSELLSKGLRKLEKIVSTMFKQVLNFRYFYYFWYILTYKIKPLVTENNREWQGRWSKCKKCAWGEGKAYRGVQLSKITALICELVERSLSWSCW